MNTKRLRELARIQRESSGNLEENLTFPKGQRLVNGQHRVSAMINETAEDEEDDPDLLCTWQTGGSHLEPPSYCDLEKDTPDEEYCPIHKGKAAKLDELNP